MPKAKIAEVFFSIQGEGVYVGTPQVFVRFFGCNIKCRFCDTQGRRFTRYDVFELKKKVEVLLKINKASYVCLTGGEPLLQANFIREFLKNINLKEQFVYLETNGILYRQFEKIKENTAIIAMDIKLPSSTKNKEFWLAHKKFLKLCKGKRVFIKSVITQATKLSDLKKAIALIVREDKDIIFVLQPNHFEIGTKLVTKMIEFQKFALERLSDVRIIPQVHKVLGVR